MGTALHCLPLSCPRSYPRISPLPILQSEQGVLASFQEIIAKIACVQRKDTAYFLFSFNSPRFRAILLPKYNCAVRVEEEYHTEPGQTALRRSLNCDSPVMRNEVTRLYK